MTLELDRLAATYARVVVGVAIQQHGGAEGVRRHREHRGPHPRGIHGPGAERLLRASPACTAATVAEFARDGSGAWSFREIVRGFDADPTSFAAADGRDAPSPDRERGRGPAGRSRVSRPQAAAPRPGIRLRTLRDQLQPLVEPQPSQM